MSPLSESDVRRLFRRGLLLLLFGAAMVVLPQLTSDPGLRTLAPWFILLIALQLAPMIWDSEVDLFAPPVLFGIIAFFAHAATLAVFYVNDEVRLDFVGTGRADEIIALSEKAVLASILGTVFYYLGYYAPIGVRLRQWFPKVRGLEWDRVRLVAVCAVTGVIFVATYAVFQERLGLPLLDFTQLGAGKRVWRDDVTLSWLMRGVELGFLPVLLLLSLVLSRGRGVRSLILPGAALLIIGLLASRLGQRGTFFYIVLIVFILFHYHRRRLPAWLFLGVYFVGMAIGNLMLAWRTADEDEQRTFELAEEASDPTMVLASHEAERQRFSSLALIMKEFPDTYPYLLGQSWASIVVAPVPRWLWPEKVNYFKWQDDRIIYQMTGSPTPAPFVGVLYANLSWLGILVGTFLFGVFHRGLYEWLKLPGRDRSVVLLYALFLLFVGPSMINVSSTIQYVLPTWLVLRFMGMRSSPALARAA